MLESPRNWPPNSKRQSYNRLNRELSLAVLRDISSLSASPLPPQVPIQGTILDGFAEVLGLDGWGSGGVGDGGRPQCRFLLGPQPAAAVHDQPAEQDREGHAGHARLGHRGDGSEDGITAGKAVGTPRRLTRRCAGGVRGIGDAPGQDVGARGGRPLVIVPILEAPGGDPCVDDGYLVTRPCEIAAVDADKVFAGGGVGADVEGTRRGGGDLNEGAVLDGDHVVRGAAGPDADGPGERHGGVRAGGNDGVACGGRSRIEGANTKVITGDGTARGDGERIVRTRPAEVDTVRSGVPEGANASDEDGIIVAADIAADLGAGRGKVGAVLNGERVEAARAGRGDEADVRGAEGEGDVVRYADDVLSRVERGAACVHARSHIAIRSDDAAMQGRQKEKGGGRDGAEKGRLHAGEGEVYFEVSVVRPGEVIPAGSSSARGAKRARAPGCCLPVARQ